MLARETEFARQVLSHQVAVKQRENANASATSTCTRSSIAKNFT
jgi:hypothetical protein